MKVLVILLSVISFMVETKSTVKLDGSWPYDIGVSYACTYQKGDVRAGDTATLSVTGLENLCLKKAQVYLKSNKSSGAGIITISADGQSLYRNEGSFHTLFGEFDNENFHPIGWEGTLALAQGSLAFQVVGTQNSLHIEKFEIEYEPLPTQSYSVTLMNGDAMLDVLYGATVTLPSPADEDEWTFAGWTPTPFYAMTEAMETIPAGEYIPSEDIRLWAVYRHTAPLNQLAVTELEDGVYIYANLNSSQVMSGGVWNGKAGSSILDMEDAMQWYEVTFDDEGLATIRLLYVYGEEYIGYEGTALVNAPTAWNVYHEGNRTVFYTEVNNKIYVLLPNRLQSDYTYATQLFEVLNMDLLAETPTGLLQKEPLYLTCYTNVPYDVVMVNGLTDEGMNGEWVFPFGNYELVIKNGKKELRLNE